MWRAGRRLLLGSCVLAVVLVPSAQATPGALDPSFGTGGKKTVGIDSRQDSLNAVAIQPDGKIVGAGSSSTGAANTGDQALVRLNVDGSLDSSFGSGGTVLTVLTPFSDYSLEVLIQPDAKIVVAGKSWNGSNYDFTLVRYNSDGSLDTSFGSGGSVVTDFGSSHDEAAGAVLQPDGKIVVAGGSQIGATYDFSLARYTSNGSLDTSFGSGGKVTTQVGSGADGANAVALQPDGKIVATGFSSNGSNDDFALVRYNADGSIDTGFGLGGKVTTPIGSAGDTAWEVAIQPDGKLVAVGSSSSGLTDDFALARYNADGSLDTGFGSGGKVTTPFGSSYDDALAARLQPDGRIVAVGYSNNGTKYELALARYMPDGSLDTGFGSGGKVTTGIGSNNDFAYAAALQSDGRIVAAGSSQSGSNYDFAFVRYLGSTLTVAKTGTGSGTVTSSPAGLDCGSTCSAPFAAVPVTLTAAASVGSTFTGWSGDCSGTGTCTLTMSADHAATATFESDKTLAVAKAGSGSGSVSSSPAGIACGSTCSHAYPHGTSVTLTASASSKSKFAGWSGACTGTGACALTMSADHSATATFKALCVVPKVKGKKLRAAKSAIKRAHCSVGKVTKAFSARVRKGRVISQKPAPGKKLPAGSKVKLKVSKGPRS